MTLLVANIELLQAFRQGEQSAMHAVYLHYGAAVFDVIRYGFRFQSQGKQMRFAGCRNENDAEDLMQEVFRRALEEHARLAYDGLRPYRDYLLAIARNHIIDELRKKRPRLLSSEEEEIHSRQASDVDAKSPEDAAIEAELWQLIESFHKGLNQLERNVFDLRFGHELDQIEVGQKLNISRYKARKIEAQLRKQLYYHLKRHGYLSTARPRGEVGCGRREAAR